MMTVGYGIRLSLVLLRDFALRGSPVLRQLGVFGLQGLHDLIGVVYLVTSRPVLPASMLDPPLSKRSLHFLAFLEFLLSSLLDFWLLCILHHILDLYASHAGHYLCGPGLMLESGCQLLGSR